MAAHASSDTRYLPPVISANARHPDGWPDGD